MTIPRMRPRVTEGSTRIESANSKEVVMRECREVIAELEAELVTAAMHFTIMLTSNVELARSNLARAMHLHMRIAGVRDIEAATRALMYDDAAGLRDNLERWLDDGNHTTHAAEEQAAAGILALAKITDQTSAPRVKTGNWVDADVRRIDMSREGIEARIDEALRPKNTPPVKLPASVWLNEFSSYIDLCSAPDDMLAKCAATLNIYYVGQRPGPVREACLAEVKRRATPAAPKLPLARHPCDVLVERPDSDIEGYIDVRRAHGRELDACAAALGLVRDSWTVRTCNGDVGRADEDDNVLRFRVMAKINEWLVNEQAMAIVA